jgi:basic membrane lipoprotein Med (substrate-binding protein (PBP1-ABC) superfamily)
MQALARLYSDIQFVLVGSDALASPPTTSNVNVLWATLHEARYLAGVVGGGMVPANGSICYIKAFEYPEVIR